MNSTTVRYSWIDIAKGIATLLVVYRHVLYGIGRTGLYINDYLWNLNEVVYSFRMPLFFILSGFFFSKSLSKRSKLGYVRNRARLLIYPYLLWAITQVSLQILLSNYTNSNRSAYDYLQILIQPRAIDQLWFLYSLFNVTVVYMFLKHYLKLSYVGLLILSLFLLFGSTLVDQYSPIHDLFYFMLYFLVGDFTSNYVLKPENQAKLGSAKALLMALPLFITTQWFWLNYPEMNIYLFAFVALYGSFFILMFSIFISKYRWSDFFEIIGKNSLQIYVSHVIISSAFRIAAVKFLGVNNLYILLAIGLFTAITIPLLIVRTGKKYNWLNYLFRPPWKAGQKA